MHFPQIHGGLSVTPQAGLLSQRGSWRGACDETERARPLTENHRRCDSIALTKSLPITAPAALSRRACPLRRLRRHCPGCGSQRLLRCRSHPAGRGPNSSSLFPPLAAVVAVAPTEGRLWQAASFPVSFWRNVWYNGFAALPAHFMGREVKPNGVYFYLCPVRRSECSVLLHLQVA